MLRYIIASAILLNSAFVFAMAGGSGGNIGGIVVTLERGEVFSLREDRSLDLLSPEYALSLASDAKDFSTSAAELFIIDRANSYSISSGGLPYEFAVDKNNGTVDFKGDVLTVEELIDETKEAEE